MNQGFHDGLVDLVDAVESGARGCIVDADWWNRALHEGGTCMRCIIAKGGIATSLSRVLEDVNWRKLTRGLEK